MDFNSINMASANSARKVAEIAEKIELSNRQAANDKKNKEIREIENHNNLNFFGKGFSRNDYVNAASYRVA